MRLTVLGGSAAGPNPGAGCSGYLVRDRDTAIVIDLGPGTVPELKKHIDPRTLDGIVISHGHLDHTLDLATLRYSLKYAPSPAWQPIPVWTPPGMAPLLDHLARAFSGEDDASTFYQGVMDIRVYDPEAALTIGSLTLTFAPGMHYVPSWAMRVAAEAGTALGYTADTGPGAQLGGLFAGVDLLIAEATLLEAGAESDATRGHLTAGEAGRVAKAVGAKSLLLTHLWDELGRERLREQAAARYDGRIELARPGLILNI